MAIRGIGEARRAPPLETLDRHADIVAARALDIEQRAAGARDGEFRVVRVCGEGAHGPRPMPPRHGRLLGRRDVCPAFHVRQHASADEVHFEAKQGVLIARRSRQRVSARLHLEEARDEAADVRRPSRRADSIRQSADAVRQASSDRLPSGATARGQPSRLPRRTVHTTKRDARDRAGHRIDTPRHRVRSWPPPDARSDSDSWGHRGCWCESSQTVFHSRLPRSARFLASLKSPCSSRTQGEGTSPLGGFSHCTCTSHRSPPQRQYRTRGVTNDLTGGRTEYHHVRRVSPVNPHHNQIGPILGSDTQDLHIRFPMNDARRSSHRSAPAADINVLSRSVALVSVYRRNSRKAVACSSGSARKSGAGGSCHGHSTTWRSISAASLSLASDPARSTARNDESEKSTARSAV